ncbi:hypothetical protein DV735_g778, partial [Chaetothyriales sp. CBS 134920]
MGRFHSRPASKATSQLLSFKLLSGFPGLERPSFDGGTDPNTSAESGERGEAPSGFASSNFSLDNGGNRPGLHLELPHPTGGYKCAYLSDNATYPRSKPPRSPRHIPIVIPDFANPYDPYICPEEPLPYQTGPDSRREADIFPVQQTQVLSGTSRKPQQTQVLSGAANRQPLRSQKHVSPKCRPKMNSSEVSLGNSEASIDDAPSSQHAQMQSGAFGISPGTAQQNSGPTHLSGLVCSVHRTTGQRPHALVGATTTILGDLLFVFGGRLHSRSKAQLTSTLYQLDLIKRHWTKVETLGSIPPPRYFHSMCALGDTKLVCYGGMSPRNQQPPAANSNTDPPLELAVMSDIHVYDVPTRTWTLIASLDNPQGRYAHCAAILPSSAVFTSADAPRSALHHNPSSSDPHSGSLGVEIDGAGGAEMIVVGGQDNQNNYIEQINVFNLRSLKWTGTTTWDRKCGAYKSMIVPMTGLDADLVGQNVPLDGADSSRAKASSGTPMLIYSNYNFLDVKLELHIRFPDGGVVEKPIAEGLSPPGLRFPSGGILDNRFVVSGTHLTSSKHEYALWALDLRTLTWARIDTNLSVFEQGSWNRGVLWNRRNTLVILGHRERSLVDDYNHRRINFSHVCMVELEAFGLYDNPRKTSASSGYVSVSAPPLPSPSSQAILSSQHAGGRPFTRTAEQLGLATMNLPEISDMELVALYGERLQCNSSILSRRWGRYFNMLLARSSTTTDKASMISEATTLRPLMQSQASRNSTITITPGVQGMETGALSKDGFLDPQRSLIRPAPAPAPSTEIPSAASIPASRRPRSLFLPHMVQTLQLLLHFLYTSSLPPVGTSLCTPQILCSLLQMARPYQIDGLLEATVERLHEVLDGRNAAAVFNAAAMAAGGGRSLVSKLGGAVGAIGAGESQATGVRDGTARRVQPMTKGDVKTAAETEQANGAQKKGHIKSSSVDSASTHISTTSTEQSQTDSESVAESIDLGSSQVDGSRDVWVGGLSSVIGLQKRGLRGLMEGKRLRERANTLGSTEERAI